MNKDRGNRGEQTWIEPGQHDREVVPNGFRATFRAWAHHRKYPDQLIDQALALRTAAQASNVRAPEANFSKRAAMMAAWERYCNGGGKPT